MRCTPSRYAITFAVTASIAGCAGGDHDTTTGAAKTEPRPEGGAEGDARPEDSPFLDDRQRADLRELRALSKRPLSGEVFERGGTIRRLELAAPTPAPGGSLAEMAEAFVLAHARLWKIEDKSALAVIAEQPAGDCSTVVFQLVDAALGLPVWNALLAVTLTEDGTILGVAGSLAGTPFEVAGEPGVSAETATKILAKELRARGEPTIAPAPVEVILDPFFYGDEPHAAARAWLFAPRELRAGETPSRVAAVSQRTGAVVFAGPVLARAAIGGCGGDDPTVLPVKVALDPHTETPAFVDLSPLGGLEVAGGDPVARAYGLMGREPIARLFGDTAPQVHLKGARVAPWIDGRTVVTFDEHSNGRRVEGASMQVIFDRGQRARSIFARYVYRPNVQRSANVALATARVTGDAYYTQITCAGDPACEKDVAHELAATPPSPEEVILSSRIFPSAAMPPREDRLAWRLGYARRVLYVNAWTPTEHGATVLLDLPRNEDAIPHDIHNMAAADQLEIQDGVTQPGISPHADSIALRDFTAAIDTFFLGLGRNGFDGAGTRMPMRVQWTATNAMFCPAPCSGFPEPGLYFGASLTGGDVAGHEFTHAITNATSNLVYAAEPGALNESYSDVFGNLIFPDATAGSWLVGETTPLGAIRDMRTPGAFGHPGHVGLMTSACMAGDNCVHTWSGVPNRAAVLIADGGVTGDPHPGVGRPTLAALYLQALVTMSSTDQFVQQQLRTVASCRAMAGQQPGGRTLAATDCDFIVRAFREVGIDPQMLYGYQKFSTGVFGGKWEVDEHVGERLFNGCTLADHVMWGLDDSGAQRTAGAADAWAIDFGEWGARITARGADTDVTDRQVSYHMWSNWFQTGVARPIEVISRPAHITRDEDCFYPLPPNTPPDPARHFRRLYSTTRVSHWATFLNGGRGDDPVNTGVVMPAGCQILGVAGVHYHRTDLDPGVVAVLDHGSHGFTTSRASGATDPRDLSANAHWWHDGLSAIALRVVYDVLEPDGTDCSVPGATQATP